jgi:hypothetical protein
MKSLEDAFTLSSSLDANWCDEYVRMVKAAAQIRLLR